MNQLQGSNSGQKTEIRLERRPQPARRRRKCRRFGGCFANMRAKSLGRGRQRCRTRTAINLASQLALILLVASHRRVPCVFGAANWMRMKSRKETVITKPQHSGIGGSDASLVRLVGDRSYGERNMDTARRAQIIDVETFDVKLAMILNYLDEATADVLAGGDPSDPIVHRFCSAVNRQSGGSQARKSAEGDGLTLFTRSDYPFPSTGCNILGTNFVYMTGGPPGLGPGYVGLEILFSQEVLVSPLTDEDASSAREASHEQVYEHVSHGFIAGTGGKAKFRRLLKSEDGATGQTITQFESIEDVEVIDKLNDPVPRPTASPTGSPMLPPTAKPTLEPRKKPTRVPTEEPTRKPTKKPVPMEAPTLISVGNVSGVGTPSSLQLKTERPTEKPVKASGGTSNTQQPETTREGVDSTIPTAAVAAAAGAGFGILVVGLLSLYRCHTEESKRKREHDLPVATAIPAEVVRTRTRGWSTVQTPPSPPSPKLQATQPQLLGARRPPPVLAVVTDADGRSLAESTLGDRTAGRKAWAPPPPPPPVHFLNANWTSDNGTRAKASTSGFSVAAASQISSLDSGTIGAGGQTVGGFSLDAAIRDDDTDDDEKGAIQAGVSSTNSDDGVAENDDDNAAALVDNEEEVSLEGTASVGETKGGDEHEAITFPSECTTYGIPSAPITPNDSLVGTASLFDASSVNSAVQSSGAGYGSRRTSGPSVSAASIPAETKLHGGGAASAPLPPPDQTPRASGNGGDVGGARTYDCDCVSLGLDAEDTVEILLPMSLSPNINKHVIAGDSNLADGRPGAVSPDSPSVHSEKSWASAFAEGTGAILSASLGAQHSDGSDASTDENISPPPPPPPHRDESPTPPVLVVSQRSSPSSAEKRGFPTDFPEWPLADPPFSDGSGGSRFDGRDVSRVLDKSLAEAAEITRDNLVASEDKRDGLIIERRDESIGHAPWLQRQEGQKTVTPDQSAKSTSTCSSSSSSIKRLHPEDQSTSPPYPAPASEPPSPGLDITKISLAVPPSPQSRIVSRTLSEGGQNSTDGSIGPRTIPRSSPRSHHSAPQSRPLHELGLGSYAGVSSLGLNSNKPDVDFRAIAQVAMAAAAAGISQSDDKTTALSGKASSSSFPDSPCSKQRGSPFASPLSPQDDVEAVSSKTISHLPTSQTTASAFSGPIQDNNSAGSNSSSSSVNNPNPWLLDALAGTLGPRGQSADMESLSERSVRSSSSLRSNRSNQSKASAAIDTQRSAIVSASAASGNRNKRSSNYHRDGAILSSGSVGSRSSRISHHSQYSSASRSIASDLQRLEAQLNMLGPAEKDELNSTLGANTSSARSIPLPSGLGSKIDPSSEATSFVTGRSQMNVTAPPGRLGVILANRSGDQGTVVSALRTSSVLVGKVLPGDRLVAIDGQDVSGLNVGEVTAIMAKRAHKDRILTIVTPSKVRSVGPFPTTSGSEKGSIPSSALALGSSIVNA